MSPMEDDITLRCEKESEGNFLNVLAEAVAVYCRSRAGSICNECVKAEASKSNMEMSRKKTAFGTA